MQMNTVPCCGTRNGEGLLAGLVLGSGNGQIAGAVDRGCRDELAPE